MKRLVVGLAIIGVVVSIVAMFLFRDNRSRLKVDVNKLYGRQSFITSDIFPERRLVQELTIEFEVGDALKTRNAINAFAKNFKGFVDTESQINTEGFQRYLEVVRVSADSVDQFVDCLEKLATKIERKQGSSTDVTEEYIDVRSRIATKKKIEVRYQEIIKQASTVKDILEIEAQIGIVRSDIESMEKRLAYLEDQTSLATLNIEFYERNVDAKDYGRNLITSLNVGWTGLLATTIAIVKVWPLLFVFAFGTWIYFRRKRKLSGGTRVVTFNHYPH